MKSLSLHPDSIKQSSQTSPPPSNDFLLPVDSDQAHCQVEIKTGDYQLMIQNMCMARFRLLEATHDPRYLLGKPLNWGTPILDIETSLRK